MGKSPWWLGLGIPRGSKPRQSSGQGRHLRTTAASEWQCGFMGVNYADAGGALWENGSSASGDDGDMVVLPEGPWAHGSLARGSYSGVTVLKLRISR